MKSNDEFNIFGTIKNSQRLRTGDDRFSSIVFSYATCSHVSVTVTIFRTFVIPKRDELANTGSAMKSVFELISGISNGVNAFTCSPTSLYRLRTVIIFRNDKRLLFIGIEQPRLFHSIPLLYSYILCRILAIPL